MRKQDIKVGQQVGWKIHKHSTPIVVTVVKVGRFEGRWSGQSSATAVDIERPWGTPHGSETRIDRVSSRELISMAEVEAHRVRQAEAREFREQERVAKVHLQERAAAVRQALAELGYQSQLSGDGTAVRVELNQLELLVQQLKEVE